MQNLLDSIKDKASESILQARMVAQFPDLPDANQVKEQANSTFKSRVNEVREDIKQAKEEARNKISSAIESGKKKAQDAIKNAKEQCKQAIEDITSDLNDLGTSAGLLVTGSAEFVSRVAMVPPAIISTTPMGPGVSPQLAPPMLKDLMAEGNQLSKQYDDCTSKMSKLGLDRLASLGRSRASGLTSLIDFGPISSISSVVDTAMSTAKPLILATGASVGGDSGTEPEVEAPISIEYYADECSNFSYILAPSNPGDPGDISASNCLNFLAMITEEGKNPEISCNNCKNYKQRT